MRSVRGGVAGASRGICGVGYGRGMPGICGGGRPECSRRRRAGVVRYLHVFARMASRRVCGVWAVYGECVVFAGWPAAEASRGRRAVFAGAGMGGVWAGNAWYLRGGRPTEGERSRRRRRRVGFAWYLRGVILQRLSALKFSCLRRPKPQP